MSVKYENFYQPRNPRAGRRRGEPNNDTVVVALTIQILICGLLLLTASIAKKVDETGYSKVKAQYISMTTDISQNGKLVAMVEEWTTESDTIFTTLERYITSILQRFTGNASPQDTAQESQALPLPEATQPQQEQSNQQATPSFQFNYLEQELPEADQETMGTGGMYLVDPVDVNTMAAPKGSTFAAVLLGGAVKPPVTGLITSQYAYRVHPISGNDDFHTGMDIAAEEGRSIVAALPGEVVEVGESDIYGKYIVVKHSMSLKTFYGHCSEILAKEGTAVRQGERIAKVGMTGIATGPHLHFSVIANETFTDPVWILGENIQVVE